MSNSAESSSPAPDAPCVAVNIISPDREIQSLSLSVQPETTANELKELIRQQIQSNPAIERMRLIVRGRLFDGAATVRNVVMTNEPEGAPYTCHLVLRELSTPASAPATNTTQQNPARPARPFFAQNPPTGTRAPPLFPGSTNLFASSPQGPNATTTSGSNARISSITTRTTTTTFSALPPGTLFHAGLPGAQPGGVGLGGMPNLRSPLPRPDGTGSSGEPRLEDMNLEQLRAELARVREQQQNIDRHRTNIAGGLAGGQAANASGSSINGSAGLRFRPDGNGASNSNAPTPPSGESYPAQAPNPTPDTPRDTPNAPTIQAMVEDAARRRALLESLAEIQSEEALNNWPGSSTTPNPNGMPPMPSLQFPPPQFAQPQNPQLPANVLQGNNPVYLLTDPSGRPMSLLVGPQGQPSLFGQQPQLNPFGQPLPYPFQQDGSLATGPTILPDGTPTVPSQGDPPPQQQQFQFQNQNQNQLNEHAIREHVLQAARRAAADAIAQGNLVGRGQAGNVQVRQVNLGQVWNQLQNRGRAIWMAIKLIAFVMIINGSGGWRRMLYLGSIAAIIWAWQIGLFDEFLRDPPPPTAPAPAPAPQDPNNPDPQRAAQLMAERRDNRLQQIYHGAEHAVVAFIASLVPGLHERRVDAVERQRLAEERVAEARREVERERERAREANAAGAGANVNDAPPVEIGGVGAV